MDSLRPRDPPSPVLMAEDCYRQALETIREARTTPPGDARMAVFLRASRHFSTVLEMDGRFRGARTNLGYCYIELGRHGDAKREIEQAIREFPDDASALINYAVILEYNHRSAEAERYLRRAILVDSSHASAYRDLAYLLEHQRKYRAAADNLERYLALDPHANDERAVRQRIKLLRQRSVAFELPDRVVTPWGPSADLRMRAWSMVLDAALWIPAQVLVGIATGSLKRGELFQPVWLAAGVFTLQTLAVELFEGSLGHIATRIRIVETEPHGRISRRALREAARSGPFLLALLLPWPANAALAGLSLLASVYSAFSDNEGRAWFDRLTGTRAVESDRRKAQLVALLLWLLITVITLVLAWTRVAGWWASMPLS